MRNIVASIALLFVLSGSAFAHAHLDHASPKVGSTVSPPPQEVVLWFTEKLEAAFSTIEVRNEQGAAVQVGKANISGDRTQLRVSLKTLPPGTYKVIWQVMSVDTHRTQGDFAFRVGP